MLKKLWDEMWLYWEHLGEHIENLLRTSMWTIENLWEHKLKHQNPKKSWTSHPPLTSPQKEKNYSLRALFSWRSHIDWLIINVLGALGTLWATDCKIETNVLSYGSPFQFIYMRVKLWATSLGTTWELG
jgi:hypothetical protein